MPRPAAPPKYQAVYGAIAEAIRCGGLRPGDRLPAERELSAELGVSRATVRRAIRDLAAERLVQASVGRGSFVVAASGAEQATNLLASFTDQGVQRGLRVSSRVLSSRVRHCVLEEADEFSIAPGAELFVLDRVRLLDDVPIAVEAARVPLDLDPLLPSVDFASESLWARLGVVGHPPALAEYTVQASAADARHAEELDLGVADPVLVTVTRTRDPGGRVIEIARSVYRPDRYRFQAVYSAEGWPRHAGSVTDRAPLAQRVRPARGGAAIPSKDRT